PMNRMPHQLRGALDAQLVLDVLPMRGHSLDAEMKVLCNLACAEALADHLIDLEFPVRKTRRTGLSDFLSRISVSSEHVPRHVLAEVRIPARQLSNRLDEVVR